MNQIISQDLVKTFQVAEDNHYLFRVIGQGDLPEAPIYRDGWWLGTVTEVPREGIERVEKLKRAGVRIKGFVVAHETPKLLMGAEPVKKYDFKVLKGIVTTLGIFGGVLLVIPTLLAGIANTAVLLFAMVLIDPALIVVLEDGTWVEVATWLE